MTDKKPDEKPAKKSPVDALKIRSTSRNGFRRCGREFSFDGVILPLSEITTKELAVLKAEPNLVVSEATI